MELTFDDSPPELSQDTENPDMREIIRNYTENGIMPKLDASEIKPAPPCTTCKKIVPLRAHFHTPLVVCADCKAPYCSAACKKKDVKTHRKTKCGK